jgi:hypothetical protein
MKLLSKLQQTEKKPIIFLRPNALRNCRAVFLAAQAGIASMPKDRN